MEKMKKILTFANVRVIFFLLNKVYRIFHKYFLVSHEFVIDIIIFGNFESIHLRFTSNPPTSKITDFV